MRALKRLENIERERIMQKISWGKIAEHLPITSQAIRMAFTRSEREGEIRVNSFYLETIEDLLGIGRKEKTPPIKIEDVNSRVQNLEKTVLTLGDKFIQMYGKQEKTELTIQSLNSILGNKN